MATSPPLSQPVPMRSPEKAAVDLRHPVPDLQSLQGAYVGNIERLEEHAERMSEAGSDLQEEIRKTYSELKLTDSRRSSLQAIDEPARHFSTRSRNLSTSSHANSIVELNGNARWGGYSPGGYVTSPGDSLRSRSASNPTASAQRQRSESKASRLGQVVHPEEVEDELDDYDAYPGSPRSHRSAPLAVHQSDSPPPPSGHRKVSSFTRIYDEIANGLPEDLRNSVILGQAPHHNPRHRAEASQYNTDHRDLPDRPPTAASTDTTHQSGTLWHDFDGAHCPDPVIEEEPTPSHSRHSSSVSYMMRSNPDLPSMGALPPDDDMVFYPAPVPKMLNLPKRLSQLPVSTLQARRRTQLLESMQTENRKSTPMLGEMMADTMKPNNRKSRQSLMALPPQLRASAYFDNSAAPPQEFAVKGESAEHTLDSILDASARAPVSAFTDHPFAGNAGNNVYRAEHKRKTSKLPEVPPTLQETRRRSSFNLLDTKRNSSGDPLNKLKKRKSSADMNLLIVKASESRMSLGGDLEECDEDEYAKGPHAENDLTPTRPSFENEHRNPDDVHEEEALEVDEEEEEEEEEEQQFGAPTTLLAELQLRKAKQKTRNMNYATLLEQGMINGRQTLLQMDDLAEKEKQRRIRRKVNLAWEAPVADDDSDDDVPLGVLYQRPGPQQNQPRHQSMGLIAQRQLEDSEPLSSRRSRLRGVDPNKRGTDYFGASQSQLNLAVPPVMTPAESDEEEGETLADRMRRLKEKQMREEALGADVRKSTVSGDFAAEMMNKFGAPESEAKGNDAPRPTPSPGAEDEEETLGQRRARLQAEAAARGDEPPPAPTRPVLRSSGSLADLLAANPLDQSNQARKVSDQMLISHLPQGSLLHQNVLDQERKKQQRLTATMRATSYGSMDPLLRGVVEKNDDDVPLGAKIQAYKNSQNPMFNGHGHGQGNAQMMPSPQQAMLGMNAMGIMSQPNLSMSMPMQNQQMMPMGMGMGVMGMQQPQHPGMLRQSSMMSMPMQMNGMQMGMQMPMGMNGMPLMMQGQMMGPPMDPRQRDQIDRWVQGVRH
ncbi:hypothetical protein EJ02DRAFT_452180 [Clathrospora elynae]|uniref:Uncharacterized protein n=1 Tax=Clathrospora elynae TaxID=706981 RepID=A0A6A5T297_9PLEO|nr:hypothetical protein EJ02DRAFT_452180 [Clathrospora elynae]